MSISIPEPKLSSDRSLSHQEGEGVPSETAINPMKRESREPSSLRLAPRCGARNRAGNPCQRAASKGKTRCRLHGGAASSKAPKGKANGRYRHGQFTCEAMETRALILDMKEMLAFTEPVQAPSCLTSWRYCTRKLSDWR